MAIRQYIGARYMPKFVGTYDATQAYEALSVVDNGMGSSYICNQPTPPNTPLTDSDYWQLYGSTSGAIIHLQDQIDDINDDITDIDSRLDRRIIILSDSYGTGYTPDGDNTSFITLITNNFPNSQIIDGALYNASFAKTVKFLNGLTAIEGSITNHDTITDIYVVGGYNDHNSSAADISSNMATFATHCRTEFPNAKLHVVFCANAYLNTTIKDELFDTKYNYSEAALNNGMSFYDCANVLMSTHDMSSDGYHPNSTGQSALSGAVGNIIFGSDDYKRKVRYDVNPIFNNSDITTAALTIIIRKNMDFAELRFTGNLKSSTGTTITGGVWKDLGEMTNLPIRFLSTTLNVVGIINLKDLNSGTYVSLPCTLTFDNNHLFIRVNELNSAGTGYQVRTVSEISFQNFGIMMKAEYC